MGSLDHEGQGQRICPNAEKGLASRLTEPYCCAQRPRGWLDARAWRNPACNLPVALLPTARTEPMADRMLQFVRLSQHQPEKRDVAARRADFGEIYQYGEFDTGAASQQASRCSQCGVPFC